ATLAGRADGPDLVLPPSLHDQVPHLEPSRRVAEVDLEADLTGPPRPGHDDRDAVHARLDASVIAKVHHVRTEQVPDDLLGLRALDLERRDVRLAYHDLQAGQGLYTLRVQQRVGVRHRAPEVVLPKAQQHGVVHHAAVR